MTSSAVVLLVIRILGLLLMELAFGSLYLTWVVIQQAGKIGPVDPIAVALVGSSWTLTGAVATGLVAMLVSTKTGPTSEELHALSEMAPPAPLPVTGPDGGPVETTVVDGEAGRVSAELLVLIFVAACVGLITWHTLGIHITHP